MKKILVITLVLFSLASVNAFSADGNLGLGIIVGEPTGVSGKLYLSGNDALDAAASWSFVNELLYVQADYIRHFPGALGRDLEPLTPYLGIGGLVILSDNLAVGARAPIGLSFFIPDTSFEIFLELGPSLLIIPETDFEFNGGLGIRYYF